MFTLRQQVYMKTGFVFVAVFFLAQVGGLDGGTGLLWGIIAATATLFLLRQNLKVEGGPDVLRDEQALAAMLSAAALAPPGRPMPPVAEVEPTDPAAQIARPDLPPGLAMLRNDQPDDLKMINGIGPKIETALNALGYFHFDQIAAWTPEQARQVDETLPGTSGRALRDDWVDQARRMSGSARDQD